MTKYAIAHKETGKFLKYRINGQSYYTDEPENVFETATEAAIEIVALGAELFLEVKPVSV